MSEVNELMVSDAQAVRKALTDNNLTPTLLARYAREQGDVRPITEIEGSYKRALHGEQPDLADMSLFLAALCKKLGVLRHRYSDLTWTEHESGCRSRYLGFNVVLELNSNGYEVSVFESGKESPFQTALGIPCLNSAKDRGLVMLNAAIERVEHRHPLMEVH